MLWGSVRARLVACIWLGQALRVQVLGDWMVARRPEPVRQRAKAASEPGSQETRMESVSPGPGSWHAAR
jgi:hypothetical protein